MLLLNLKKRKLQTWGCWKWESHTCKGKQRREVRKSTTRSSSWASGFSDPCSLLFMGRVYVLTDSHTRFYLSVYEPISTAVLFLQLKKWWEILTCRATDRPQRAQTGDTYKQQTEDEEWPNCRFLIQFCQIRLFWSQRMLCLPSFRFKQQVPQWGCVA